MAVRSIDQDLLSMLACPKCKHDLTLAGDEKGLICETCKMVFPIRDGVPVMLVEEAFPFRTEKAGAEGPMRSGSGQAVAFLVVEGKNKGERIEIEKGTCRALGRSLDDAERTKIFSVDAAASLDENSKKLVMQYLSKQFQKSPGSAGGTASSGGLETLGGFLRGNDIPLKDIAISRLHAMLFYDEAGTVGILDLVSKNGTYVNGAEVESKILKKGDLITIGGTKIRFEQ